MIKFNNKNNSNKQENVITIRDIRVGTIINIHLVNENRGDKGFCDCEIIAVFNSAGQQLFNVKGDFCVIYNGKEWFGYCKQINKIISY